MSQSMPPNYDERNREESISARVYREIKNKILQLDYLPGSYLTEARLAEEYGVSRMPVRIAIQKLSSEGWLLSDFRRKLRVKDVTQKSVQDLFSFREIIETLLRIPAVAHDILDRWYQPMCRRDPEDLRGRPHVGILLPHRAEAPAHARRARQLL